MCLKHKLIAAGVCMVVCTSGWSAALLQAVEPWVKDSSSSAATEANAIQRIPLARLTATAQESIRSVVDRPSFFRRLPTQTIECDPDLFMLLVRYPEIIVNIWDLMGITKVEVKRSSPYVFHGQDGAGTTCRAELLYGTSDVHVYYGNGAYSGTMAPREIDGRCVCVLHSSNSTGRAGQPMVTVTMDVFMKLDNLGADLLTRTLGSLVGKTADYNFVESAKFVAQLYELCRDNPMAAQQLASRLNRVDPAVRARFAQVAAQIATRQTGQIDLQVAQQKTNPTVGKPTSAAAAPATSSEKSSRTSSASFSLSDSAIIVPAKPVR